MLGSQIYAAIWPEWETSQNKAIASICEGDGKTVVWVAELAGTVVGFIAYELDEGTKIGEMTYLAVDPDYQNQGVGTELNRFALSKMRECGMTMARVETGADSGHAAARRLYEKAGYVGLPLVRYFQDLW